jgi:hypothetical protein
METAKGFGEACEQSAAYFVEAVSPEDVNSQETCRRITEWIPCQP